MSYRRRYSPSYSSSPSTSLIKGPSSIYTTTSSVLGGGNYLRDSVSSLRTGSSLSPRRYPRTTGGVTSTSAGSRLTSTTSTASTMPFNSTSLPYQSRSRSARISSYLNNDSDIFRCLCWQCSRSMLLEKNWKCWFKLKKIWSNLVHSCLWGCSKIM